MRNDERAGSGAGATGGSELLSRWGPLQARPSHCSCCDCSAWLFGGRSFRVLSYHFECTFDAGAVMTLVKLAFMAASRSVAQLIAAADPGHPDEPDRPAEVSHE
ncbi:hypothetical protein BH10PLA2_BH10PLA2_11370 [soil metagenome]